MLVLSSGYTHIDRLGARRFQYRSRLLDFHLGTGAALVAIYVELQRHLVLRDRVLEQLFLSI